MPASSRSERQSNLELLRIFAMFLIVCHHIMFHGAFLKFPPSFTTNAILSQLMSSGGKVGVDIFVIITGYFLIEKAPKITSIVKLYLECVFYLTAITLIFVGAGRIPWSPKLIRTFVYPFGLKGGEYWFVAAYLDLMLVAPFITIGMRAFSKKQYLALLIVLTAAWSGFRTFSWMFRPVFSYGEYAGFSILGWFVLLFLWGGYVRKFVDIKSISYFRLASAALISILLLIAWILVKDLRSSGRHWQYVRDMNSMLVLAMSMIAFLAFAKLKPLHIKAVNIAASTMFGVYLIHDVDLVRRWLWPEVIRPFDRYNDWYFILYCLGASVLVLIACSLIDFARQLALRPFQRLLSPLSKADAWLSALVRPDGGTLAPENTQKGR